MYNGYATWETWECMNHFREMLEEVFEECDGDEDVFEARASDLVAEAIDCNLRDYGLDSALLNLAASIDLIDYADIFNTLDGE